jgi:hypothetical protein
MTKNRIIWLNTPSLSGALWADNQTPDCSPEIFQLSGKGQTGFIRCISHAFLYLITYIQLSLLFSVLSGFVPVTLVKMAGKT